MPNTVNSLLFDYYGALLGARPREVYGYYHEDNLSLTEIADVLGVTKQAVHAALKKAESRLAGYETDLGLVARHEEYGRVLTETDERISTILKDQDAALPLDPRITKSLRRIRKLVSGLDL
jgi:predicted DNA-binding protein YlxM (UPF0122 family)